MKLKINEIDSFSGLPNLVDENGVLVCVPMNQVAADEIMLRVNGYEKLVDALRKIVSCDPFKQSSAGIVALAVLAEAGLA